MGKFKVGDIVVPTADNASVVNKHWDHYFKLNHGEAPFYFVLDSTRDSVDVSNKRSGRYLVSWLASRFEAWKPKVGDLVRVMRHCNCHGDSIPMELAIGSEHAITAETKHLEYRGVRTFTLSGGDRNFYIAENLEPIPAASIVAQAQPAPLKIEAGKTYVAIKGQKIGPMVWNDGRFFVRNALGTWNTDGTASHYHEPTATEFGDLIAEWQEPVATVAANNDNPAPAKPKFKVGDRVRGTINPIEYEIVRVHADGSVDVRQPGSWCQYSNQRAQDFAPIDRRPTAIVALIEDGQPKPNSRPFIHHTVESATTEAARLAGVYKGSEFGVYVMQSTAKQDKPTYEHEWQRLAAKGEKIAAIKELRAVTGLHLKTAKDAIEDWLLRAA